MVVSMERWVGKVAVVTGASSGIGRGIARKLVEEGLIVVGLARRKERIDELSKELECANGKLYGIRTDMSNEEDIKQAFQWTYLNVGPVNILINNAGIHLRTSLLDDNTDNWRKTINVNILGLCIATREAIKIMQSSNIEGQIIHINSNLGHSIHSSWANLDVYPATKFAVTALTETMRIELNNAGSKIKISSISPGIVDTEIFTDEMRETEEFKENVGKKMLSPEDVADATVFVLSTPQHVRIHELRIKPINEKW